MAEKSFNCQMDIAFAHTRDGRPELYDFLWEHLPNLMSTLHEKKITVKIQPPGLMGAWAKLSGMKREEVNHLIQKVVEDKRFHADAQIIHGPASSALELNVRADQLDHLLNAYNVLLERLLPYLTVEGKNIRIDFSPTEKNAVKCYSTSADKPLINTFLVRNFPRAPRVRSIVFATLDERRRVR